MRNVKIRRIAFLILLTLWSGLAVGQTRLTKPFADCHVEGSTTIFDLCKEQWTFSDSADATKETLPASTFKVINLLIALQTGVIKDENDIVKWVGKTDTTLYGYRPEIYRDLSVKEAFERSAGWVFVELAKKIGKKRYERYLKACGYGNLDFAAAGTDFWNFGSFAISPIAQVRFLVNVYNDQLPFSKRNLAILKRVMITETTDRYSIRSKTGWTRWEGNDIGWWIGYVTTKDNVYFFATRTFKKRTEVNADFGDCRKTITKSILRELHAID